MPIQHDLCVKGHYFYRYCSGVLFKGIVQNFLNNLSARRLQNIFSDLIFEKKNVLTVELHYQISDINVELM